MDQKLDQILTLSNDLKDQLSVIRHDHDELKGKVEEVCTKVVEKAEKSDEKAKTAPLPRGGSAYVVHDVHKDSVDKHDDDSPDAAVGGSGIDPNCPNLYGDIETEVLTGQFRSIKDTYQKVPLPSDLKLSESKVGILRQDLATYNVLVRNARYTETLLKILCSNTVETIKEEDLKNLFLVMVGQMRYIQEEYSSLYVKGQFGQNTANFYRQLQKNTSALNSRQVPVLESAVKLANVKESQPQIRERSRFGGTGRGFSNFPFRGGRGYRGRGSFNNFPHKPFGFGQHTDTDNCDDADK